MSEKYYTKYYKKHKEQCKARMRERNKTIKIKVLEKYCENKIIKCKHCEECNILVLALDHINGGGRKHRKECKDVYAYLIRENFPEGFQVLCSNCNYIKRCINNEVRLANGKETLVQRKYHSKLRLKLIEIYSNGSNQCKNCKNSDIRVLCLDHINSDGCQHRRKFGGTYGTWRNLKKTNYPPIMQVLCQNCNRRKMHENKEFGIRFSKNYVN